MIQPERIRSLQDGIAPALALHAGMELDLFSCIGDGPRTSRDIADALGVGREGLERLLYALVVAGLLELDGGGFRNGAEARTFLVRGRPDFMGDEHQLLGELWRADLQTAASIRQGRPTARHDFAEGGDAKAVAFMRGLVPSALRFGRELAATVDLSHRHSVLDVGGGTGTALVGIAETNPQLRLTLFEIAPSLKLAELILAENGWTGVRLEEGDILAAPSSRRHDVVLLKAVIQLFSAAEAATAIGHVFASLDPGGSVYISGAGILDDDRTSPAHAAYYNLTFLNLYPHGASYTRSQYAGWLSQAGFVDIAFAALPSGSLLISANRP